jgi:hypothetical protein
VSGEVEDGKLCSCGEHDRRAVTLSKFPTKRNLYTQILQNLEALAEAAGLFETSGDCVNRSLGKASGRDGVKTLLED